MLKLLVKSYHKEEYLRKFHQCRVPYCWPFHHDCKNQFATKKKPQRHVYLDDANVHCTMAE